MCSPWDHRSLQPHKARPACSVPTTGPARLVAMSIGKGMVLCSLPASHAAWIPCDLSCRNTLKTLCQSVCAGLAAPAACPPVAR